MAAAEQVDEVRWHDLECGGYTADLALWRELAAERGGPVLDVGAGTGRVALELARAGHAVTALDRNATLLATLRKRAVGLPVTAALGDARDFHVAERFSLCLAPMQTVQLLGGSDGRVGFLLSARRHLRRGGVLAAALADPPDTFDAGVQEAVPSLEAGGGELPLPDLIEHQGWVYCSQPVAIRRHAGVSEIHRVRQTVAPDGAREAVTDVVRLDELSAPVLEREAIAAGFTPLPRREIAPTREHVGSTVVMLSE